MKGPGLARQILRMRSSALQPYVVGNAPGELLGVPYDGCARFAQRGHDGGAVERLVEEEDERVRRP